MVGATLGNRLSAQTTGYGDEQSIKDRNRQNRDWRQNKSRDPGHVSHFKQRGRAQQKSDKQASGVTPENAGRTEIEHQESGNRPGSERDDDRRFAISAADVED